MRTPRRGKRGEVEDGANVVAKRGEVIVGQICLYETYTGRLQLGSDIPVTAGGDNISASLPQLRNENSPEAPRSAGD